MIPILYSETETAFSSMGICSLSDCKKVIVKRVLNGKDELELTYPVGGQYFDEIKNSRQILVQPEYKKSVQAYRIYQVTKPMSGFVTVNARHISERRNYTMVKPFTAGSVTQAISRLGNNIVGGAAPWTFYTDKSTTATYKRDVPSSLGSVLGGSEGSFLDIYGGEYEFDMYQVRLLNRRGIDRGVEIAYGKNLQNLEVLEAVDDTVITGICPIWTGEDQDPVYLPEYVLSSSSAASYPYNRVIVVDFSGQFQERPTEAQLRAAGQAYLSQSGIGEPKLSLKVNFVHLAEFPEYASFAVLETLNLGDTVHVHHLDLGVDVTARIVELAYDVLGERYTSVVVGKIRSNMSSTLKGLTESTEQKIRETKTKMQEAIEHATDLLVGGDGGYFVTTLDQDGHPTEALFMDTDDVATATNVLRINRNGIGFSTHGVNGPYTSAWTIDGHFVADFITTGKLNANLIKAGVLEDEAGNFSLNLVTGALSAEHLSVDSPNFKLTDNGDLNVRNATLAGKFEQTVTKTYDHTQYTQADFTRARSIILGDITPTEADYAKYDLDMNGFINMADLTKIGYMVNDGVDQSVSIRTLIDPETVEGSIEVAQVVNGQTRDKSVMGGGRIAANVFSTNDRTFIVKTVFGATTPNALLELYSGSPLKQILRLGDATYGDGGSVQLMYNGKTRVFLESDSLRFYNSSGTMTGQYPAAGLTLATMEGGVSEQVATSGTTKTYTLPVGTYLMTIGRYSSTDTTRDGVWLLLINTDTSGGESRSHITPIVVGANAPVPTVDSRDVSITTNAGYQRITIAKLG